MSCQLNSYGQITIKTIKTFYELFREREFIKNKRINKLKKLLNEFKRNEMY